MARVVHFEIPVTEPERARSFYREVFGWEIGDGDEGYWLASTGGSDEPGVDGGLITRSELHAAPVLVVGVASVDDALAGAAAAGAEILHPKHTIPGVGYSGYLRDPEGNVIGVFEAAPPAAG